MLFDKELCAAARVCKPELTQAALQKCTLTHTGRSAEMHLYSHRPQLTQAALQKCTFTHTGRSAEMHLHSHRPRLTQAALQKCTFTHTGRDSHRPLCRNAASLTQAEAHTGCSAEMHLHSHRPRLTQAALQKCTFTHTGRSANLNSHRLLCRNARFLKRVVCATFFQVLGSAYPWIALCLLKWGEYVCVVLLCRCWGLLTLGLRAVY